MKLATSTGDFRWYYETLTEALPGVKLYINIAQDGSTEMLLPLENFVDNGGTVK